MEPERAPGTGPEAAAPEAREPRVSSLAAPAPGEASMSPAASLEEEAAPFPGAL